MYNKNTGAHQKLLFYSKVSYSIKPNTEKSEAGIGESQKELSTKSNPIT